MPTIEQIAPDIGFGTSGVRALVTQLSDRVVYAYTAAFLSYLKASGQLGGSGKVILAHDLRPSSPAIAAVAATAIATEGLAVEYAGAIATPALALRAMSTVAPGIMVTGSHIPFDRNGIKFYTAQGEILKADEQGIRSVGFNLPEALFAESQLRVVPLLPGVDPAASQAYVRRYQAFFPADMLAGNKVGLYQHSSVARDMLAEVLRRFGAEVVCLGRSDQFIPIDTEAVAASDEAQARAWCAEHDLDALVSTDGDADRPLVFDETGKVLRGDIVGILGALYLGATGVATPVSSNTALEACGQFEQVRRTRIGSPYVIEAMQDLTGHCAGVVGFEANGGFLVGSTLTRDGKSLSPLPTRDALLPILALFALARDRRLKLSQLASLLPERHTASDRLQGIATELSQRHIGELAKDKSTRDDFFSAIGKPVAVDLTDGLRVTLDNHYIIHFRPSGNAPELRCYVESASQAEAERLLAWGLARLRRVLSFAAP